MAAEPVKPGGRSSREPRPAMASLFEWALTLVQEREADPVGATLGLKTRAWMQHGGIHTRPNPLVHLSPFEEGRLWGKSLGDGA